MIRFILEFGKAYILDDCITENGWIISFDSNTKLFNIWSNVENEIEGASPDKSTDTLEGAYLIVSKYT